MKEKKGFFSHLKEIGFSNRLSIYILIFLLIGLAGGFVLAIKSIESNYLGSLLCWTVVFTPIGTAVSLVMGKVVDKSRAENTVGGIKYDTVMYEYQNETKPTEEEELKSSPAI